MSTKIYIEELKAGRYRVRVLEDDTLLLLLRSTRVPFYDGARALEAHGFTGPFEMWDRVRPYPRMLGDIATAAKLTVKENNAGIRIVPYEARPAAGGRAILPKNKKLAHG